MSCQEVYNAFGYLITAVCLIMIGLTIGIKIGRDL